MSVRPRRSVLYMPGSNIRAMQKAKTLAADALVLDLEDAVAPESKESARLQVIEAVQRGGYGHRELVIRVNTLDTQWGRADLEAVARSGADAVCLPKVESAEQVTAAAKILEAAGAPEELAIWVMVETPKGVLNAAAICGAHPRLAVVAMGTSDLAKDLRVPHTPDRMGFITSLSLCVLAARQFGLDILDGVHLSLDDETGLRRVCEQGHNLGFDGKTLIHPKQLQVANEVFAPAESEVARAGRIKEAWLEAQRAGKGVAVVDGKLVENLHVEEAERTLQIAGAIASVAS